ncbi:Ras family protein [Tritrichomonas foetus]|uniref:Ras family protein n=1 Tax=Tritrichomonas foetus TaxID=1144522 RepID=A0A1J4KXV1_9EUKA|nr:Ras family protein [Tritrichomonas foetus]|eukprot:OHT14389.1 Ras family protein [Tritrichomonas foetus]
MESNQNSYKIVIVGASGVGKTSLVQRLIEDSFYFDNSPTIGVEFKCFECKHGSETIKLNIWDTAGQEKFRSVSKAYFRNAVGALLVFSFTDRASFDALDSWMNDIQNLCPQNSLVYLIGNKIDLSEERVISQNEAENFAKRHSLEFFETSAFTSTNVNETFVRLAGNIHEKVKAGVIQSPTLQLKAQLSLIKDSQAQPQKQQQGCC